MSSHLAYVGICLGPAACTSNTLKEMAGNDVEILFSIREELHVREFEGAH